jgi:hypothetical protein
MNPQQVESLIAIIRDEVDERIAAIKPTAATASPQPSGQTKVRLKWADCFGRPRQDLSFEELKELAAETQAEALAPQPLLADLPTGVDALAASVVAEVQAYVKRNLDPLHRRIAALEAKT